jgi:hypothetical protein
MKKAYAFGWNSVVIALSVLGAFGYLQLEENINFPRPVSASLNLGVIPVFLALIGVFLLKGRFGARLVVINCVSLLSAALFGAITAVKSTDPEAFGYLLWNVILMMLSVTFAFLLIEILARARSK